MSTLMANIPDELRSLERWVCANSDSKRPMKCFESKAASVTKPDTWGTYQEAQEAIDSGVYEYAGFVFADDGFIGVDLDHAVDEFGLPTDEALEIINMFGSYTELSKSGNGFHIICKGDLPFKGKTNRNGIEIYKTGRFFVLTGRTVMFSQIEEKNESIVWLLHEKFQNTNVSLEKTAEDYGEKIWQPHWSIDQTTGRVSCYYDPVTSGNRHLSMVSYCGALHTGNIHPDVILECALEANAKYMIPPMADSEVNQIVDSVIRYRR